MIQSAVGNRNTSLGCFRLVKVHGLGKNYFIDVLLSLIIWCVCSHPPTLNSSLNQGGICMSYFPDCPTEIQCLWLMYPCLLVLFDLKREKKHARTRQLSGEGRKRSRWRWSLSLKETQDFAHKYTNKAKKKRKKLGCLIDLANKTFIDSAVTLSEDLLTDFCKRSDSGSPPVWQAAVIPVVTWPPTRSLRSEPQLPGPEPRWLQCRWSV